MEPKTPTPRHARRKVEPEYAAIVPVGVAMGLLVYATAPEGQAFILAIWVAIVCGIVMIMPGFWNLVGGTWHWINDAAHDAGDAVALAAARTADWARRRSPRGSRRRRLFARMQRATGQSLFDDAVRSAGQSLFAATVTADHLAAHARDSHIAAPPWLDHVMVELHDMAERAGDGALAHPDVTIVDAQRWYAGAANLLAQARTALADLESVASDPGKALPLSAFDYAVDAEGTLVPQSRRAREKERADAYRRRRDTAATRIRDGFDEIRDRITKTFEDLEAAATQAVRHLKELVVFANPETTARMDALRDGLKDGELLGHMNTRVFDGLPDDMAVVLDTTRLKSRDGSTMFDLDHAAPLPRRLTDDELRDMTTDERVQAVVDRRATANDVRRVEGLAPASMGGITSEDAERGLRSAMAAFAKARPTFAAPDVSTPKSFTLEGRDVEVGNPTPYYDHGVDPLEFITDPWGRLHAPACQDQSAAGRRAASQGGA